MTSSNWHFCYYFVYFAAFFLFTRERITRVWISIWFLLDNDVDVSRWKWPLIRDKITKKEEENNIQLHGFWYWAYTEHIHTHTWLFFFSLNVLVFGFVYNESIFDHFRRNITHFLFFIANLYFFLYWRICCELIYLFANTCVGMCKLFYWWIPAMDYEWILVILKWYDVSKTHRPDECTIVCFNLHVCCDMVMHQRYACS